MKKLSLRIKVLIPVTGMILAAILGALLIVNQVVRNQVMVSVSQDLQKSIEVFEELQTKEMELLAERAWVTAEAPHLKAAVDTGDSTTVQHVMDEIFTTLKSDILIIADPDDKILAQYGSGNSGLLSFSMDSLAVYNELFDAEIALMHLPNYFYHVVIVPILALDRISVVYLLGKVILGKSIDQTYLNNLKTLLDCEILFINHKKIVASTDPSLNNHFKKPDRELFVTSNADNSLFDLKLGQEEYLAKRTGAQGNFLLLQSVDRVFNPIMGPIQRTMFLVAGFAFFVALLISSFLTHEVVGPVKKLVTATDAVTKGHYDHPIQVRSHDEIGQLARKFEVMRQSLQQKMAQLEQQNIELEEALKKLETTQEELLRSEKLAATGKITAQLSHELNNPIHNIQSCLEAAQKKIKKESSGREFIDLAYEEVLRIGNLIRQMLDFHRPAVSHTQLVDINQIVYDVIKTSKSHFSKNGIDLSCDLGDDFHKIKTSPDLLKQVFLNLILNAVDAMPEGGELQINSCQENKKIAVAFKDSGPGIKSENLNKIFDAFFTTKAKASGVGLGLTVSYGIIRSLGGSIVVESEPGKGSKFVVSIPVEQKRHQFTSAYEAV